MAGLRLTPYKYEARGSKFDLSLRAVEIDQSLFFAIEYFTGLLKKETIERIVSYFMNLLQIVLHNINIKAADIDILSREEKKQLYI